MQNLTISADEELIARAREVAARQGTSLNALIRAYLETVVGRRSGQLVADELLDLMSHSGGHSGGRKVAREEAYEDAL